MTLRKQALIITGAVLAVLILVLCGLSYMLLGRSFRALETVQVQRDVERALNAVSDNVTQLASTAGDWAYWDDTYEFLKGKRADYIERNLAPSALQNIRIGLFICADRTGAVVVAKRFDLDKGRELLVSPDILASGSEIVRLLRAGTSAAGTAGVVRLSEGPLLFAMLPVLTSEQKGPAAGTLLMGRFLSTDETARMAAAMHLAIDVCRPGVTSSANATALPSKRLGSIDLTNEKQAVGVGVVNDIHGAPACVLRVRVAREIHAEGRKVLSAFSLLLLALGIMFCAAIAFLLERRVLAPLARLARDVASIGTKSDMGVRLAAKSDDELADLARRINVMLDALERRLQFQEVVGHISSDMSRTAIQDTDAAIDRALAAIGAFAGADRAYVFLYHPGTAVADNTHEWCARGVAPEKPHLQGIHVEEELPWFAERLGKHEFVRVPDVVSLPQEARREKAHWSAQGIRSLIVAPMVRGTETAGFIGFDAVGRVRQWSDDDQALLRFVGEEVVHALASKTAESELRKSEEKHSTYVKHAPHGILIVDKTDTVVDANPAACAMMGYEKAELLGMAVARLISPNAPAQHRAVTAELRNAGTARAEIMARKKDGVDIIVVIDAVTLSATGVMWFCLDVTEHRKADEDLRRVSSFRESIIETASEGICACHEIPAHPFVRFTLWNKMMVELTGYTMDEINQLGWYQTMYPSPEVRTRAIERMNRMRQGENMHNEEWEVARKDGQRRRVLISTRVVPGGETGTNVLGVMDDISEQRLAEEEKARLQSQLLQAQKMESVGRLAGGVAHDFNNMLGVIIGHAELAMMENALAKPVLHHLRAIQDVAQKSADLTRQLLAFARKQTIAPMVLDMNETVHDMLAMLRRLIGEQIILEWRPGQLLWKVKMDPTQIHQILANLSVNARDAIEGVGTLTISTANAMLDAVALRNHPGFSPGAYVQLMVSDTGRGIDPSIIEHIFEPFFTTKDIGQGTGLGLATVYGIVKQNNGFVEVISQSGMGSTFTIYLPRFVGDADAHHAPERKHKMPRGKGETVLLVEDSAAILDMGKAMLEGMGYTVLAAVTPLDALQLAEAHTGPIDLLLTDVVMPEMNGRVLSQRVRELKPGMKCLFMSGYTADIIGNQGVLDDGVCFIQKPFSIKDLAAGVRAALEAP